MRRKGADEVGERADGRIGKLADGRTRGQADGGERADDGFPKGKTPNLTRQLTWRQKSNSAVLG